MGVRSLRERGGGGVSKFIKEDLSSRKIMDYVTRPIQRAGGGGVGCCPPWADSTSGGGGGVLSA